MITVKANTKRGQALISRALHYEGFYLSDVYGRNSNAKEIAWRECFEKCRAEGGEYFRICGHCTSNFTVAWMVEDGWRMETRSHSYLIKEV